MHRSRLTAAYFDIPPADFAAEVSFWAGALGRAVRRDDKDPDYVEFEGLVSGLGMMVQRLGEGGDGARVHLDIETDDIEAEVRRLEGIGAERVEWIDTWQVMRDPAGLKFCVVGVQSPEEFEANAVTWGDD
jgi:predicted enzyme related to lactoylglutathione lyase